MTDDTSDFMSVAEVARRLGLSRMTVYRMCHNGDLPSVRAGRTFRIPRTAYEAKYSVDAVVAASAAAKIHPGQTEITA